MTIHRTVAVLAMLAALGAAPTELGVPAARAADASAIEPKAGWYGRLVDADFVARHAVLPKPDGVQIIDSRPAARKYDPGHIPTALNIPDSQFDKLLDRLPQDRNTLLIFYCDGIECLLSHNSAFRAEKLGYTNIRVYAAGFPDWVKSGRMVAVSEPFVRKLQDEGAPATPAIQAGKESGTITVASFERILREAPDTIHLIDVREPGEFAAGTFKGAVNVPIGTLEKRIDELPADKPIVFFCGAGGRSGEAHDMVQLYKPALKTFFLNADVKWSGEGVYAIAEKR